jgi:hypothetical protein
VSFLPWELRARCMVVPRAQGLTCLSGYGAAPAKPGQQQWRSQCHQQSLTQGRAPFPPMVAMQKEGDSLMCPAT